MSVRIFLVEDNDGLRELLAQSLHELGFAVYAFDSGSRALELIETGLCPDVAIVDLLLMADMNGWQLAEELKRGPAGVAVIAISGASLTQDQLRQCRADAFLQKPFEVEHLLSVIERFTGSPARRVH